MPAGGFLEQKPRSPGSLAIVIALHAAAIGALALSKSEFIVEPFTPTVVTPIPETKEPPPEPQPKEQPRKQPEQVTWSKPVIQMPAPTPVPAPPEPTYPPLPQSLPGPLVEAQPAARVEPPPPPPPPAKLQSARAKANLASYVSDSDYPASAIRSEEQGTTRFRLTVGPDGRVKDCAVTTSSGSSALDSATCRIMKNRARFVPARESSGEPTSDTVSSGIRWVLPTD
jgi:protein TonB